MRGVTGGWLLLAVVGCATGGGSEPGTGPLTLGDGGTNGESDTSGGETSADASATGGGSSATSPSGSGGGSEDSTTAADTTDGGPPSMIIDCDGDWELDPELPVAGEELWAGFTAVDAHVEIGVIINGVLDDDSVITSDGLDDTNGGSPWTWWWTIGAEPGVWTLEFVRDKYQPTGPIVEGTCVFEVY